MAQAMKLLLESWSLAEVDALKLALEAEGIDALVMGGAAGLQPTGLWVVNDEDLERAREIVQRTEE
jgi:Putative prokaryotic signal transducing protein